jgi:hypothetical protein
LVLFVSLDPGFHFLVLFFCRSFATFMDDQHIITIDLELQGVVTVPEKLVTHPAPMVVAVWLSWHALLVF